MDKQNLLSYLLLEENEEEETLLQQLEGEQNAEVHPMYKTRREEGCFATLINRHLLEDDKKFREYFRLNIQQFNYVLNLIKEDLKKNSSSRYKYPITPHEKLAITLRFIATGESFKSLALAFRVSSSYISRIVQSVLSILREKLLPLFLPPLSPDELHKKSEAFTEKWQFPNCVGAIDGKHVRIFALAHSGSLFFNYKNFFSIVLLAVVDANYKFTFIDDPTSIYGKEGDSGIFEKSSIGKLFRSGNMLPPPCKLPKSEMVLPHVFVGDEAFRLHTNLMKPFSRPVERRDNEKAIFNYRLSRARRVSENAFGLLSQVFRIFYTTIGIKPETADDLVIVACCLHNLLRDAFVEKEQKPYYDLDLNEPDLTPNFISIAKGGGFANSGWF